MFFQPADECFSLYIKVLNLNKMDLNLIYNNDCLAGLKTLPDECIDCCVTSPPYYHMRDYGIDGQVGLESTPEQYVCRLVDIFHEVRRVLKKEGTLWLNLGDCYYGSSKTMQKNNPARMKGKDLIGIPWMTAFALRADGWYLRSDIIWEKAGPMPESVKDRCTKSHEHIFLLSKSPKYFYDYKAISEKSIWAEKDKRFTNGPTQSPRQSGSQYQCKRSGVFSKDGLRNKRDVWKVKPACYKGAHFATFPKALITDCVKAGCPANGIVLDPFMGAGTTGAVARILGRNYIGFELNPAYVTLANKRIEEETTI